MAAMAPQLAPANESRHSISRITREGKKITYKLAIAQEPERARACGAGAKSSADRRPVDPPPVVEMQIFESDPHDEGDGTDITLPYNANFFLYATLETAGSTTQGRLAPAPSCAVLTGVPVAGAAYLDRPHQAAYFIFSDLSVRHEGVYRLCFHLYEQTKDSKDETQGTAPRSQTAPGKIGAPHQFLDFRGDVVSKPFQVWSAKKFPGLAQSTGLSRTIAEQGCRVRIRRDVRMRRRGDKRTDDYDQNEDRGYSSRRNDRYAAPDAYGNAPERHRSTSISTIDPYAYSSERRPSAQEYGPPNTQYYQRPMPHTPLQSSTPIPPPVMAPGPIAVPSSTPSPATAHAPSYPAPGPAPPPLHTPSYQSHSHLTFNSTQTQYPAPPSHISQPAPTAANIEHEPYSTSHTYPHSRPSMERQSYPQSPEVDTNLPPLRLPNSTEGPHAQELSVNPRPRTPSATSLPPIQSISEYPASQPPSGIGSSPAGYDYGSTKDLWPANQTKGPWEMNQPSLKRTHEETFGHMERPLFNGMRPDGEISNGSMQRRPSYQRPPQERPSISEDFPDRMKYTRANGEVMSSALASRGPAADRTFDTNTEVDIDTDDDSYHAGDQLRRSLELTCSSPNPDPYSKRSGYLSSVQEWDSSASRSSCESDFLSEVSGQFDDAEEVESYSPPLPGHKGLNAHDTNYSPSSHSVKRRRSNDWPRRSGEHIVSTGHARSGSGSSTWQRWPFGHHRRHGSGTHGSLRSPRHVRPGRRSRFVEGHMADTVSEKPPSIFFPDEARTANGTGNGSENTAATRNANRGSGIFRFGKAIASAFNPFGGWGSVSGIWRSSQVQEQNVQLSSNDRLKQAQLAYEELKRSGYQGTNKGSYMASMGATSLPDETWKSIQEKMQYGSGSGAGGFGADGAGSQHSRQSSGSSLRPLFPDLRKAKSSLAIPPKKRDGQEVWHQKSRKDMQKQAKLLKRVSNLEDKLERARRELREFSGSGEEELVTCSSLNKERERPYQRKFVPGALPSLQSERLLHDPEPQAVAVLSPLAKGASTASQAPSGTTELDAQAESQILVNKTRLKSPRPWRKPSGPRSLSVRSPSRKRKSPDPESRKKPNASHNEQHPPVPSVPPLPQQEQQHEHPTPAPAPEPNPQSAPATNWVTQDSVPKVPATTPPPSSRKPKLPKTARGDSPGSVERRLSQVRSPADERAARTLQSTTRNRSATPVLRSKRGRGDLRSTTSPAGPARIDDDKENPGVHVQGHEVGDGANWTKLAHDETEAQAELPSAASTPNRRKARYEYIPPVPPLPKDLAATAAKVDRRLAREMGKRKVQKERNGDVPGIATTTEMGKAKGGEGFQWPEDIF
ncbi:sexual development activator VeA [Aspergillus undulatus]|uniref:sexual development activator VeA n=1 Tax=Aspergillus undulatus TaxID=1810928 RepID=UPI003CCDE1E9